MGGAPAGDTRSPLSPVGWGRASGRGKHRPPRGHAGQASVSAHRRGCDPAAVACPGAIPGIRPGGAGLVTSTATRGRTRAEATARGGWANAGGLSLSGAAGAKERKAGGAAPVGSPRKGQGAPGRPRFQGIWPGRFRLAQPGSRRLLPLGQAPTIPQATKPPGDRQQCRAQYRGVAFCLLVSAIAYGDTATGAPLPAAQPSSMAARSWARPERTGPNHFGSGLPSAS